MDFYPSRNWRLFKKSHTSMTNLWTTLCNGLSGMAVSLNKRSYTNLFKPQALKRAFSSITA